MIDDQEPMTWDDVRAKAIVDEMKFVPTGLSFAERRWYGDVTHADDGDLRSYFRGQLVFILMIFAFIGGCIFGGR